MYVNILIINKLKLGSNHLHNDNTVPYPTPRQSRILFDNMEREVIREMELCYVCVATYNQ
jgi:hypothetical protein